MAPDEPIPEPIPPGAPAWARLHLWQMQPVRDVLVGLGVVGLFWLGQATSIVTVPLLLAILLAYLFEPVIAWMMRRLRFSRPGAVTTVIAAAVVLVVVPAILGLTYGLVQVVGLAGRVTTDAQLVLDSFEKQTRATNLARAFEVGQQRADTEPASRPPPPPSQEESPSDEPQPAITEVDPADEEEVVEAGVREIQDDPLVPSNDELEAMLEAAQKARHEAAESRRRVEVEAGRPWPWILDRLVDRDDDHALDEAVRTLRRWVKDNLQQVAVTTASAGATAVRTVAVAAGRVMGLGFMIFLTAFFFYFLSTGWGAFRHFVRQLLPAKHEARIIELAVEFDRVISAFIRGRLTIAIIQAFVFSIGYALIGVPAAFILGPAVAVLSIVPYLALVGLPVSIALLWLEGHSGVRGGILWVVGAPTAFYFLCQALDDYVWTPLIQGRETGLDTPVILFASLAGGALFGVFGLLIAIPIAACLKILIQQVFWPRIKAWLEGRSADPLPIE